MSSIRRSSWISAIKKTILVIVAGGLLSWLLWLFLPVQPVKITEVDAKLSSLLLVEQNRQQHLFKSMATLNALFVSRKNPQFRWACGEQGVILYTKNNGKSWQKNILNQNDSLRAIYFVDDRTGWICGEAGVIWKTTDGGKTWQPQVSGTIQSLFAVYFTDANTGWVCGNSGEILFTEDGGGNWEPQSSGSLVTLISISFAADKVNGWICGSGGILLHTTDQGRSWEKQDSKTYGELNSIVFPDKDTGWVCGEGGTILKTVNGGRSWSVQSIETKQRLFTIYFSDNKNGWVCGVGGEIYRTKDGGENWTSCSIGVGLVLHSIYFTGAGQGWVASEDGTLLYSNNEGSDWFLEISGNGVALNSLSLSLENNIAWACGQNGRILISENLTQNWKTLESGTKFNLNAIFFTPDGQMGWVCGENGIIRRTITSGETWIDVKSPTQEELKAFYFINNTQGWACGAEGVLLRTQDSGETWEQKEISAIAAEPMTLYSLFFLQKTEKEIWGWACGAGGTILYTKDGGDSWTPQITGMTETLYSLYFSGEEGWACGTNGVILHTVDGGSIWTRQISRTTNALHDIGFYPDNKTGLACSAAGIILSTDDGGKTWSEQTTGIPGGLYALGLSGKQTSPALVCGEAGTILISRNKGAVWTEHNKYRKYFQWWYYGLLFFIAILPLGLLFFSKDPRDRRNDYLDSDKAITSEAQDRLDFGRLARGISRFIRNEDTQPPFSIAVTGKWGTGKSSLMNLIKEDLIKEKYCPVFFDAWYHQDQEQFLVALLKDINKQARPPFISIEGFRISVKIFFNRFKQILPKLLLILAIMFVLGAILFGTAVKSTAEMTENIPVYKAFGNFIIDSFKVVYENTVSGIKSDGQKLPPDLNSVFFVLEFLISFIFILRELKRNLEPLTKTLTKFSGGFNNLFGLKNLDSEPGFRYRLAQDFKAVTAAIAPKKLVVFIDDLDRCRHEDVMTILEAVNFLSASGNCITILGLDMDLVKNCISLNMKELSEINANNNSGEKVNTGDGIHVYAQQYMEKITNLEIPTPSLDSNGVLRILDTDKTEASQAEKKERRRLVWQKSFDFFRFSFIAILIIVFAAVLGGVGFNLGIAVYPLIKPNAQSEATEPPTPPAPTIVFVTTPPLTPTPRVQSTPLPVNIMIANDSFPVIQYIVIISIIILAGLIIFIFIRKRSEKRILDPPLLKLAYRAWYPVIKKTYSSPRTLKRFKTKIRYIAMVYGLFYGEESPTKGTMLPEDLIVAFSIKYYRRQEQIGKFKFGFEQPSGQDRIEPFWDREDDPLFYKEILDKHNEFIRQIEKNNSSIPKTQIKQYNDYIKIINLFDQLMSETSANTTTKVVETDTKLLEYENRFKTIAKYVK